MVPFKLSLILETNPKVTLLVNALKKIINNYCSVATADDPMQVWIACSSEQKCKEALQCLYSALVKK